jgi:hypothetical protein
MHTITLPTSIHNSSGTAADGGWRRWWREQARIDGTDLVTLAWQHVGALSVVRPLCGASS